MPAAADIELTPREGGVEFAVKVVPGASRTRIAGVLGAALKVAVSAPPEGGKANAALCVFLADVLSVRKGDVAVVAGHTQPHKRVRVNGIAPEAVRAALRAAPGA